MKYSVEKFCGRKYCGNAFFDTFDEVLEFADDGFCDNAIIYDAGTGRVYKLKFKAWAVE